MFDRQKASEHLSKPETWVKCKDRMVTRWRKAPVWECESWENGNEIFEVRTLDEALDFLEKAN